MLKQLLTHILISGYLAYLATIARKFNVSICWCHWCNLYSKEWPDESYSKGMSWTTELIKIH